MLWSKAVVEGDDDGVKVVGHVEAEGVKDIGGGTVGDETATVEEDDEG